MFKIYDYVSFSDILVEICFDEQILSYTEKKTHF